VSIFCFSAGLFKRAREYEGFGFLRVLPTSTAVVGGIDKELDRGWMVSCLSYPSMREISPKAKGIILHERKAKCVTFSSWSQIPRSHL
jgi:hypothetical protein